MNTKITKFDFANGKHNGRNLARWYNGEVKVVRQLSDDEEPKFEAAILKIAEVVHAEWPFRVIEANMDQLANYFEQCEAELSARPMHIYTDAYHVEANRHIMNYLSSAGAFIDITESQQKPRMGRKSAEWLRLEAFIAQFKLSSFGLRFVLGLRNYALHQHLPLGEFNYAAGLKDGIKNKRLTATFRTKDLLTDRMWSKELREEIASKGESIDVYPVILESTQAIAAIQDEIMTLIIPGAVSHAEFIMNLKAEVLDGEPLIATATPTSLTPPRGFKIGLGSLFADHAQEILRIAKM